MGAASHETRAACAGLADVIDDTQLWHVRDDQSGLFIEARDALSGVRVLDIGQPIPDQTADIQLVVQDAGAASPVAVDRGRSPGLANRAGHLPLVEACAIALGDFPAAYSLKT